MSSITRSIRPLDDRRRVGDWRSSFARRLALTDLLVVVWVVFGVQFAWLGFESGSADVTGTPEDLALSYTVISVAIVGGWMATLLITGTRDFRVIGTGTAEYKLVTDASVRVFGLVAIAAFLLKIDLARGYILLAFPCGILVLCFSRWLWRQWLGVQRQRGGYASRVLLVGSEVSAAHIARELSRFVESGYQIVGACLSSRPSGSYLAGTTIPVVGNVESVVEAMQAAGADTVAITSSEELTPQKIRELSWSLEPGRQHLIVAPSLTGIGGPRIHTRPVAGLPLIHVETPRYEGGKLFAKRAFDVVGAGLLIVLLAPILLFVAAVIKLTSEGPVFFRQERVGVNGQHFDMLKFRSMEVGSDDKLQQLLSQQGKAETPLFKVQNDPRVTPVGKILRKYSLDEFPQLINVLRGEMSLVGPRPQRDGEVALYDKAAYRRLLLKPGMSGLWQVSGRSSLSWEDAIRLDLYYVENWSMTGDLIILWRTLKAVILPGESAH